MVGGGGHGLSAAYHLANEFVITNIAVIEKGWIGGGNWRPRYRWALQHTHAGHRPPDRWRSCTMESVVRSGSDNEIAERYLSSFYFASTKAARQLSEYSDRANIEAFTEDYLKEMDEFCKGISAKLGPDLQFDYGWASPKIGKKNPNLFDLEKMLKLDHWRPRYRWALQHTHAGHRPPDRLLGVSEAAGQVFLIGPSNSGFVDPLQMTEMSLVHCLISFLFLEINIDRVIVAKIFMEWSQEIGPLALEREAFTRKRNSGFVAQFVRRFRTLGSKL